MTYVGGGEDQQRPPSRDQHLGLCEVTDTLLLQLDYMAHQRLYILGPVLISPGSRKLLHPLLQRLLQSTAGTTDLIITFEMGSVIKKNEQTVCSQELPDHVVDLQANDFHDKGTSLQKTRLKIRDKHFINYLCFSYR